MYLMIFIETGRWLLLTILAGRRNLLSKQILPYEQSHTEPIMLSHKLTYKSSIKSIYYLPVRLKAIGTFNWRIHQVFLSHGHPARIRLSTLPYWSCLQCRAWMMKSPPAETTRLEVNNPEMQMCLYDLLMWRNVNFTVWKYEWI